MIPYSTCMRFHTRRHSLQNDKYSPAEWTLVQHFGLNARVESTIINVTSQDDQTLCFTWAIEESSSAREDILLENSALTKERSQSDELDRRSVYLLLALRRRKSLQQSIHPETIPLLDPYYHGITKRYLKHSYKWSFNTFSFDVLTSGHSLSSLLFYLFNEYRFVEKFNLDLINVLRCFHYLEKGYHDTNPYHNSVHAADVTQAMHCFLQETKIKQYLTPMEAMVSLLAAVCHDLDHPGVNQQFLVATNSHLTTMHNNLSVLESHHWRFALSCFYESHIFDHFDEKQWKEVKFLLKHLILATDIGRQGEYIGQFKRYLKMGKNFRMDKKEHRYFILQIALKCADLGNPCRPWKISQRWSEQICNEFYRQGDFEKLLGLPVTPMCDRDATTISKTQTEFFKNIVRPLFELWDVFLDSKLTHQLMNNLNFNEYMWKNMETKRPMIKRSQSLIIDRPLYHRNSTKLLQSIRCGSMSRLATVKIVTDFKALAHSKLTHHQSTVSATIPDTEETIQPTVKKCINGCGTPPTEATGNSEKSQMEDDDDDDDEQDDFIDDHLNCGAILSTPALILPNFCFEKPQFGFYRRGSAPGCIDVRKSELSKGATLLLLCNSLKAVNNVKRRSSLPNVKMAKTHLHLQMATSLQSNIGTAGAGGTSGGSGGSSGPGLGRSKSKNGVSQPGSRTRTGHRYDYYNSCRASLYDVRSLHHQNYLQNYLPSNTMAKRGSGGAGTVSGIGSQRRGSVPQDIFIRSLNNYTA